MSGSPVLPDVPWDRCPSWRAPEPHEEVVAFDADQVGKPAAEEAAQAFEKLCRDRLKYDYPLQFDPPGTVWIATKSSQRNWIGGWGCERDRRLLYKPATAWLPAVYETFEVCGHPQGGWVITTYSR
jgi:hypothetical protein